MVDLPVSGSNCCRRLPGIDVARALAIIGMLTVHVSPSGTGGLLTYVLAVPRGRSAILFGLLAGIGVGLLASSRAQSSTEARTTLLWRAAILLPLGLWLQTLDHNVLVILADYAVLYLFAIVVLRWPDRWLLAIAGTSATLGSAIYLNGLISAPERFGRSPAVWGDPALQTLDRLVISGPYPLLTWAAPFCIGVWLGRRDLKSPALRSRLALGGAAFALLVPGLSWILVRALVGTSDPQGWWQLLDDVPHRQMPLWLLSATASALAVLGASLLLSDQVPKVVAPLATVGRLAFTWYVAHLVVLHFRPSLLRTGSTLGTVLVVTLATAVMSATSVLWLRKASRGPLEVLLQPPWRAR
jgi:uncharacterized membrane protein YeiB